MFLNILDRLILIFINLKSKFYLIWSSYPFLWLISLSIIPINGIIKFTLIPTVNQKYNIVKTILRNKLLGTEIYSLKKEPKNKIKTPVNKKNFTKE